MSDHPRPLRDIIAEAIYDDGSLERRRAPLWGELSDERKEPWLDDADRVITLLWREAGGAFEAFAHENSGADWLANSPSDLWRDFMAHCLKGNEGAETC